MSEKNFTSIICRNDDEKEKWSGLLRELYRDSMIFTADDMEALRADVPWPSETLIIFLFRPSKEQTAQASMFFPNAEQVTLIMEEPACT